MSEFHTKDVPGENNEYRQARDQLLEAEIALRQQIEEVAKLRRQLPLGGALKEDYIFEKAPGGKQIKFSELFSENKDTLILYNFMYGPDWEEACPMCSSLLDGYNATEKQLTQRANLAVVAKAAPEKIAAWAKHRGWSNLHLLSSEKNNFKNDYHAEFESPHGDQQPLLMVFVKRDDGIYHFWSSELLFVELEGQARHVDLTWPLWNLLDLTPAGRGDDWYPSN